MTTTLVETVDIPLHIFYPNCSGEKI